MSLFQEYITEHRSKQQAHTVPQILGRATFRLSKTKPDLDDYPIPEGKEASFDGVLYNSLRDEEEQRIAYKEFQGKEAHTVSWAGVGKTGEVGTVTTGNHNSKLTVEQKMEIRKLYATGRYEQDQLAQMYGVSQPTIYRVLAAIGK